jgi:hypothetical protein
LNRRGFQLPTPALSDELLSEAVRARAEHRTSLEAAASLGLSDNAFRNRLLRAAQRGLDGNVSGTVSLGQVVKGTSTLYDSEGTQVLQWVKTTTEQTVEDHIAAIKEAFKDYQGRAKPLAKPWPVAGRENLLTLTPCGDWHIGMYAWGKETDRNWDLNTAESVIGGAMEELVQRQPPSGIGVVLSGGDLLHADNQNNQTARSGNQLDVDGRYQKVLGVANRLMVRTIDAHLLKHDHVIVRILKGNHDEHSAIATAYFLLAWYRNEPRVTIDVDPSLFFWLRFQKVMIGATHGHTVKIHKMPGIMAHRRAEEWGMTKFRYVHGFHLHHSAKFATEGDGVISEIHQAPIPQDAWHFGAGFLSGRSLQSITYHGQYGETSRARVAILDAGLVAANDNVPASERKAA